MLDFWVSVEFGMVSEADPDEARAEEAAASIMFGKSSLSDDIWLAMDEFAGFIV